MTRLGFAIISMFALSGCVGETFDSVVMRRASYGAMAECSSGTYGVGPFGQSKRPPLNVTRCVAACEKTCFVVVETYPRTDLVLETDGIRDSSESECSMRKPF